MQQLLPLMLLSLLLLLLELLLQLLLLPLLLPLLLLSLVLWLLHLLLLSVLLLWQLQLLLLSLLLLLQLLLIKRRLGPSSFAFHSHLSNLAFFQMIPIERECSKDLGGVDFFLVELQKFRLLINLSLSMVPPEKQILQGFASGILG